MPFLWAARRHGQQRQDVSRDFLPQECDDFIRKCSSLCFEKESVRFNLRQYVSLVCSGAGTRPHANGRIRPKPPNPSPLPDQTNFPAQEARRAPEIAWGYTTPCIS